MKNALLGKLNLLLNNQDFSVLNFFEEACNLNKKIILGYLNIYTFDIYSKRKLTNSSYPYYFIPDGIGMFLYLKIFNFTTISVNERIVSTDYWDLILSIINSKSLTCSIYGGEKGYSEKLEEYFYAKYPNIKLHKIINGYTDLKDYEILSLKSDVVILGLGTPKQEKWILENYEKVNIPILLMVGSAIDFWSGAKKRAPLYLQKLGLEWLYRLFQEPKRLWKRYILGIPVFIYYVLKQKLKLMFKKGNT